MLSDVFQKPNGITHFPGDVIYGIVTSELLGIMSFKHATYINYLVSFPIHRYAD
jgi:hypothetical protein